MDLRRTSGLLLHPTSLPGPFGIGDLGKSAFRWVDFLAAAEQHLWQVLPLGPTGYADSPYQCFSTFAGNPLLVSPERMAEDGLLSRDDLARSVSGLPDRVDYGAVIPHKRWLLGRAHDATTDGRAPHLRAEFDAFRHEQADWLDDFALFMALKDAHAGAAWTEWESELVTRRPRALARARGALAQAVERHAFCQFLFFRQWAALKEHARSAGVTIIGDAPIFVAADSADVWAHPELFLLDTNGRPTVVAGVPPDYFSATGQRWGNPLYRWDAHRESGYAWWIARLRRALSLTDVVRLDHFRGLHANWEVPADRPTAEIGRWVRGPGADLLQAVQEALGDLPLIAEDLGVVTPDVVALRDAFELPGMRVLQFAFQGGSDNPFLPHHYVARAVVYTGTHDNDATRGWYATASEAERDLVRRYLGRDGRDIAWDLIRAAWSSVADYALAPLQDVLDLGSEARMNTPGTAFGNWQWRFREEMLTEGVGSRLAEMSNLYSRVG